MNKKILVDGKETKDPLFTENNWNWFNFEKYELVHTQDANTIPEPHLYFMAEMGSTVYLRTEESFK